MLKLGKIVRGHFVTIIEISVHEMMGISRQIYLMVNSMIPKL